MTKAVKTAFESGADIENEVLAIVNDWLIAHILKADSAYAPFFKERGAIDPGLPTH